MENHTEISTQERVERKRKCSVIAEPRISKMEILEGVSGNQDEDDVMVDTSYISNTRLYRRRKSKNTNRMFQPRH